MTKLPLFSCFKPCKNNVGVKPMIDDCRLQRKEVTMGGSGYRKDIDTKIRIIPRSKTFCKYVPSPYIFWFKQQLYHLLLYAFVLWTACSALHCSRSVCMYVYISVCTEAFAYTVEEGNFILFFSLAVLILFAYPFLTLVYSTCCATGSNMLY